MAASANPSGNQDGAHAASSFQDGGAVGNPVNGNSGAAAAAPDNSAVEWTSEEVSILDEGLAKYASKSSIVCYRETSLQLHERTVRDVAMRCRWMSKEESGKRRKDDHSKKNNKKGVSDTAKSSHLAARPGVPPYQPPLLPLDNDGLSDKAIRGTIGYLLEQNAQYFNQISVNLSSYQVPAQENISLFCQIRENIRTILNETNETGVLMQRPLLPVKVNEELANSILPALGQ